MNNKQKLLTATAITGTVVSASAFTLFDYAICRRKKQPDVRKKEKWKPYLDYVLKEQEWLKEHQEQELKEIKSKDGLTLRAAYIPREDAKGTIICMHGYHSTNNIEFVPEVRFLSWIQHSSSMAEKPRKKRRPLHYLWSQRTPRSQTLDFVYESPFRSEEQRHLPMWNFDGMCYDLNGSRTRSPRQCQRNHRRLRLHFTMGYHQTCSQRQIPSSTISTYVYGKFSQRDNRRIRTKRSIHPRNHETK